MIISPCPRCGDDFRVPEEAALDVHRIAECPWCREQFPIDEIIEQLPPEVIIIPIADTEQSKAGQALTDLQGINLQSLTDQVGLDPENTTLVDPNRIEVPNLNPDDVNVIPDNHQQSFQSVRHAPLDFPNTREKQQKKSSGLGTLIGIILGGFASLPLAGLILIALGKSPDLGFWPFDGKRNEPSRRSAAPLPSSDIQRGIRGTPLRFNQPPPQDEPGDSQQKALNAILGDTQQIANRDEGDENSSDNDNSGTDAVQATQEEQNEDK